MSGISKRGCISVAAVMAADGSALTAGHFRKARKPAQSKVTKALMPHHLAPSLGEVPSGGAERFWLLLALFQKLSLIHI